MSLNTVTLTGRIGNDPEIKYFESGACKASISLAVDEYVNGEKRTHWIAVEAWSKTAEVLANYAGKGKQIGVQGFLKVDSYQDKDGNNRKHTFVRADRIELLGPKGSADDSSELEF